LYLDASPSYLFFIIDVRPVEGIENKHPPAKEQTKLLVADPIV
jgi:hypothetical protein